MSENPGPESLAVQLEGITKRFPGVLANDHIDLDIRRGEIHALLGENGAGKSTLMSILAGLYRPDEGQIRIYGEPVTLHSPRDAIAQGIGMVHQHFMLVDVLTVGENVTLGLDEPRFLLKMPQTMAKIETLSDQYGLKVDPRARIWQLSVGEQQRVEIIKMLYRGARILILDEPTAVLTPGEVGDLFAILRQMVDEGHSVVFISHKLDEVMEISDRVTVLRRGRAIGTVNTSETSPGALASLMVGREMLAAPVKALVEPGEVLLEAIELEAQNDKGMAALQKISLAVRAGEIVGIAGVAGNGQNELAEAVTGLRHCTGGRVTIGGEDLTNCSPKRVIDQGVSHIPEDRLGVGLAPNLAISDNVVLKTYRSAPVARGPFLHHPTIGTIADGLITSYSIAAPNRHTPAKLLSGGNLQKTILAREISAQPKVMIAVHPTRGLDVGATENVHRLLLEQRERGCAVLLISEDLDELLAVSDRIAIMYEGTIMGIVAAEGANLDEIGLMMAGVKPASADAEEGHHGA
jgi:general nucleoside transport system ATP-binding protein